MDIRNSGDIDFNKELTKEAVDLLDKALSAEWEHRYLFPCFQEGAKFASIEEYYDSDMEGTLKRIIEVLAPLGYVLNGGISYWGDYDGTTYVDDNVVTAFDKDNKWKKEADDNEIISILEKRGYTVAKNETENEKDAGLNNKDVYTHDEATRILEAFEDLLSDNDIIIPSPEDDDKEEDNDASLYGSVYSDLLDKVEADIIDITERVRNGAKVVEYEYSGTC